MKNVYKLITIILLSSSDEYLFDLDYDLQQAGMFTYTIFNLVL